MRDAALPRSWCLLPAAATLFAGVTCTPGPPRLASCSGPAIPLPQVCGADLRPPTISCEVPADVQGELRQPNVNLRQRASDLFSWQNFIALNWPALAGARGAPDPHRPIGGSTAPTVWETWKETSEVFRDEDGQPVAPAPWDTPQVLPAACRQATKLLFRDEKVDDSLDAVVQPTYADGTLPGTLTDQARRRVRYEIRLNRTAFEYIVEHGLWDGRVQAAAAAVSFPPGAQIAKAAWRELDAGDTSRFQSIEACVCETGPGGAPIDCGVRSVGLVGFHLMTKTASAPQWIWSTFEQVDNVAGSHPSFYDPACRDCPPNRQRRAGEPNQVTRVIPIPAREPDCAAVDQAVDDIVRLNQEVQHALAAAGTKLSHYELISTQWPFPPSPSAPPQPATVFEVAPALLGNTTLETYIQDTSSCMGCHAVAGVDRRAAWVSADFTFTLNDAYPNPDTTPTNPPPDQVPRSVRPIPPPEKPVTPWDQEHWGAIVEGYQIALRTYEMLPRYVASKLHCSSCHLGGGRDPEAAWWVGMHLKYPTPESLYNRINQCFERSENGTALCYTTNAPPEDRCVNNPSMGALVTFMDWLDEQWRDRQEKGKLPNGFPCLAGPATPVDEKRGASIYLQKCAFCHNSHGQGRYENAYYRPAVWGPDSYNADAGMGTLATLAAFLHANMPYGNAGALTPQEAWDVAYFIERQPRPGRTSSTGQPPATPVVCPAG